ncbi:bifunctional anthranilate synthase component I family protein/class IV aminotransferase [Francisella sp. 19X1-34]|uniref:bifunctional chorismate-binding protein/class IV aminotransferase n=1 Tax=Francisella sp. 19X1-34 TaxID=3087177 RepID=UPI002E36DC3E|nr:bifunctional anthranilate synthase component I family protein/class IV aminotransferase [Francisella sp. 19X1-34]MED7788551.1 bifunctional anthranilate synthase component I family protein/class IV aminotransferase [Francisella sp. 19X1-34]
MSSNTLPQFAIFEDTLTNSRNYYFYNSFKEVIAYDKDSLELAFCQLEMLQQQGLYLAGYISYEAGYYLKDELKHLRVSNSEKLLHFVAFKEFSNNIPAFACIDSSIDCMLDSVSYDEYLADFAKVQQALVDGESYEINLTKKIFATSEFSSQELYSSLKQNQLVKYAAYLPFLKPDIISISPELFFKKKDNTIVVKPMKGTAKLSGDEKKDLEIFQELESCDKNKAENLIIVDLLRNDLSAIADTHTVKVDKLFLIEKYKNLLQMTSQISANVDSQISFRRILDSLFPCGSITGAPKKRTLELIDNIERQQRGAYTGSIGYILPNNDMCFNVAIRTIQKYTNNLQIGVGGGITVYSDVESEWHEMDTKIGFIKRIYKPKFSLIESLYYYDGFRYLDLHLERLESSARRLFFEIDILEIKKQIKLYCQKLDKNKEYKIRFEYSYDKSFTIEHNQIDTSIKNVVKLIVCPEKIDSKNNLFQYKTTHNSTRGFYTKMHNKYVATNKDSELIFLNENDYITETRFHNIIIEKDRLLYTPKLEDGVLDGVARRSMIIQKELEPKHLTIDDLKSADNIYLVNSVRGLIPAYLED